MPGNRGGTLSRGSSAGFTLIEVLMVVIIIGIMVAFAAPQINFTRYRVDGAMRSLGTTLLAAQRMAVTRQHDVVVMFDTAGKVVRVLDDANNDGTRQPDEHVSAYPIGDNITFGRAGAPARGIGAAAVTYTQTCDAYPSVTFHRDGSASEYGGIYLTSTRQDAHSEDTREVETDRATGRASWFSYNGSVWSRGF